ncbi:hypothetical protein BGZ93_006139 [Podila epicladia]|nr:hypothetical protein BGZ92_009475 [Podila epicladia]KAG0095246.1 hypothetical protein BGZ93_006139 [Podila epicladia]
MVHTRRIALDSPTDGPQEKKPSLFSLSSRGRMALLWASTITLFIWVVLERSLLLQSISSPAPLPSKALKSTSSVTVEPIATISLAAPTSVSTTFESTPIQGIPSQPQPTVQTKSTPKMIDIILFNSELDLLDLRLNELQHVVDTFVIIESNTTFSGHPKKLYYKLFSGHFKKLEHKIHHIELPPISKEDAKRYSDGWANEHYARDKGVSLAIQELQPREGDWLLLSDLDEVPRPSILQMMKYPELDTEVSSLFLEHSASKGALDLFRFGCRFYYYSFEYYKGNWIGPVVMRFRERASHLARVEVDGSEDAQMLSQKEYMASMGHDNWATLGSKMRDARGIGAAMWVDDACWHCSWCFSRISEVVEKSKSYSHTEHNQDQYHTQEWILDHYRRGEDLFNREYEQHTLVQRNYDIPDYVRFNRNKYLYMLERYGAPNAGFIDVRMAPVVTTAEAVATATTTQGSATAAVEFVPEGRSNRRDSAGRN